MTSKDGSTNATSSDHQMEIRKSSDIIEELRKQEGVPCYDEPHEEELTSELNIEKLQRGQHFFQKNLANCILGLILSLVYGLGVSNLLEPLMFTEKSDTSAKSFKRYVQTLQHLLKWHFGKVWEKGSEARKSLDSVRRMHTSVQRAMNRKIDGKVKYVTQFDMSLVQTGFIGYVLMNPEGVGISCSTDDLDDYVYFWRWIGFYLGISNHNNICCSGYRLALQACRDIDENIVYPSVRHPPADFTKMAKAYTDGLNKLTFIPIFSYKSLINFTMDLLGRDRVFEMNLADRLRILYLRFSVFLLVHCPKFKRFCNRNIKMFMTFKVD